MTDLDLSAFDNLIEPPLDSYNQACLFVHTFSPTFTAQLPIEPAHRAADIPFLFETLSAWLREAFSPGEIISAEPIYDGLYVLWTFQPDAGASIIGLMMRAIRKLDS